jgi:hypothetical protein
MKLILIAAAAVAFASTSAFACGTGLPYWADATGAVPCAPTYGYAPQPQWRPTPLPQPQTTYGSIGNQSFSITQWPNGYITIDR